MNAIWPPAMTIVRIGIKPISESLHTAFLAFYSHEDG